MARGEISAPPPRLVKLAASIDNIPLDESPAEGWHRSTHFEVNRAAGGNAMHMVQIARFTYALGTVKHMCHAFGEQGRTVVRRSVSLTGA